MGYTGFYVCVKCVRCTLQYKCLLNSDHSRKMGKVIIVKNTIWGRKYGQFGMFAVFGIFRYL